MCARACWRDSFASLEPFEVCHTYLLESDEEIKHVGKKLADSGAVGPKRRAIPVCLVFFRRSPCFAAGAAATVCKTHTAANVRNECNYSASGGFVSMQLDPGIQPFEALTSLN